MRLRVFRAHTMAAAMAEARAELGPDALILSTRRTDAGVELTAALEDHDPPATPIAPPPDPWIWHGAPAALLPALRRAEPLERLLPFAPLDLSRPLLLAGPPGAGKTLSLAKLATRLVLAGQTPMLISTDGARAGAAEQLLAFSRVLGLGVVAAPQPSALHGALARRPAGAPLLIDTAGLDPFDPEQMAAIAALANIADAAIALVLPAGLHPEEAGEIAAAFAAIGAHRLIATRLDQARRLGGILAAGAAGLAFAEAGISASPADGLVPLTPALLAHHLAAHTAPQQETAA